MKKRLAALVACVAMVVVGVASAAPTPGLGYKWNKTAPFTLKVKDSGITDPQELSWFQQSLADWSASSTVDLTVVNGGANITATTINDPNSACGITNITPKGVFISSVLIQYNLTPFCLSQGTLFLQRAVCQELGHSLGLDHNLNATEPSCMAPAPWNTNWQPSSEDFAGLVNIYGG